MKPSLEGSWTVVLPFHVIPESVRNKCVTKHAHWEQCNKQGLERTSLALLGEPMQISAVLLRAFKDLPFTRDGLLKSGSQIDIFKTLEGRYAGSWCAVRWSPK